MPSIHLTIGPMGAGKSDWLIRKYRGRQAYGDIVEAFVPHGLTRCPGAITSRTGGSVPATTIDGLGWLRLALQQSEADCVFIDEAHHLGRHHRSKWLQTLAEFPGREIYISSISVGWDWEMVDPACVLIRTKSTTSVQWLSADCSVHGPECRAAFSWKKDPDGPAEGDLGSEYLSLCFDEYLPRYQAWRCGVDAPKPEPTKYRPAAADFNLELAGGAHESRDLEPLPRGRVQHGTHGNPAPLIPAEYPRWKRPDYSSWTPLQPDSSDPEPIRSA